MRGLTGAVSLLIFCVSAFAQDARYAVILSDPTPGAARDITAARARILNAQTAVRRELNLRGLRVTGSAHTFLNAVFVSAKPADIAQAAAIPGVSHIAPLHRFHLDLDHAEQLINVPAAWALLGGTSNAGAGVKIGVIDTGIEATHPAFQDSSLTIPSGFPICRVSFATSALIVTPFDCSASDVTKGLPICSTAGCQFTNSKVIVARSYVPLLSSGVAATSHPDDWSPRDRIGHGTAVAMAAAGETSTGPADTITGVAPKAFLGSYKVFGSPGVNNYTTGDVVIQALEDAYADGMDIVVMSLGAPALSGPLDAGSTCGLPAGFQCDTEAYVVQQAVNHGMVVVAAAGNGGQNGLSSASALGTIDSPGDAPGAIAVAATTNSHSWANDLTVNGLGTFHARFGSGPVPAFRVSGTLGDVASVGDPLACTAPPAGSLNGLYALVQRGTCTFAVKVQNLQIAGAAGVIITNTQGDDTLVAPSGLNSTTIPAVFIGYDDGQSIRTYLSSHAATVTISPTFAPFDVTTYNQVAPFSSHGPALGNSAVKPDVAAVGVDLYLAGQNYDPNGELYTPSGFLVSQGTSFSAPQVAGVAALVKQANPAFTAVQIRSSIINTSTQDLTENGSTAPIVAVGAGKVSAAAAVLNTLSISPATVSFGTLNGATLPLNQQIQLTNTGTARLNLTVSIARSTAESTAHTSIDLPNLTIAAGQRATINLTLSGSVPVPGIYTGFVNIQGAPNAVNIPYLYIVGDGIAANLISLAGNGDDGTVGKQTTGGYVILQAIDQYGVPVSNLPVTFSVSSGGGRLVPIASTTDHYGLAAAQEVLGPSPGTNVYSLTAGGLTANFQATGESQPVITPGGIVTAGTFSSQPPAPGSYISIFGNFLSNATATYSTPYLPISLNSVSVSFDNPNVSVPGHIVFVSPGQINLQIPWELAGQPSVQVKVTAADSVGAVYTMPLGNYSPELFQFPSGGQNLAAALDENNNVVTAANPVARGHVVQLFANGLGPVTNQPASGDPAPFSPLAETTSVPVVTIGGVTAQVLFYGMTPGNAGLYQINATVPDTSTTGLASINVSIGGVTSPVAVLPVK